jgi:hypothetical protein
MLILNDGTYQPIARRDNFAFGKFNQIFDRHLQRLDGIVD